MYECFLTVLDYIIRTLLRVVTPLIRRQFRDDNNNNLQNVSNWLYGQPITAEREAVRRGYQGNSGQQTRLQSLQTAHMRM